MFFVKVTDFKTC